MTSLRQRGNDVFSFLLFIMGGERGETLLQRSIILTPPSEGKIFPPSSGEEEGGGLVFLSSKAARFHAALKRPNIASSVIQKRKRGRFFIVPLKETNSP